MDTIISTVTNFWNSPNFFTYHGYGLTLLWIVACTIGIVFKKINIYLHALAFFIVDVSTVFLVGGAFYRYYGRFSTYSEWTTVKQIHIFGGIFVLGIIIAQHIGGVLTLFSASKKNSFHRKFSFWVTNIARVVVILGWIMKGDQAGIMYTSIASAVLLIASFYMTFLKKENQKHLLNPEDSKTKTA